MLTMQDLQKQIKNLKNQYDQADLLCKKLLGGMEVLQQQMTQLAAEKAKEEALKKETAEILESNAEESLPEENKD